MKKCAITFAIFSALTVCVFAGPEPMSGKEMKQVAPAPTGCDYSWTGFYVGVNGGGSWGDADLHTRVEGGFGTPNQILVSDLDTLNLSPDGGTGGGQLGYNYQIGHLVLGAEVDFQYFGLDESRTTDAVFVGGGDFTLRNSLETNWLLTARPRIGFAFCRLLVYGTGGLAVTDPDYESSLADPVFGTSQHNENSDTRVGWTVGGGLEYAFARKWSLKVEYLYSDFDSVHMTSTGGNGAIFHQDANLTANTVRAGLNFHF